MPSKIDANTTEIPINLNYMAKNKGETNNNYVPIDHSSTASD